MPKSIKGTQIEKHLPTVAIKELPTLFPTCLPPQAYFEILGENGNV